MPNRAATSFSFRSLSCDRPSGKPALFNGLLMSGDLPLTPSDASVLACVTEAKMKKCFPLEEVIRWSFTPGFQRCVAHRPFNLVEVFVGKAEHLGGEFPYRVSGVVAEGRTMLLISSECDSNALYGSVAVPFVACRIQFLRHLRVPKGSLLVKLERFATQFVAARSPAPRRVENVVLENT